MSKKTPNMASMRDNVERWMIHEGLSFDDVKTPENAFHMVVKHGGKFGISIEIFEPKSQPGILVVGAKIVMKNNHIARYLGFSGDEKARFEKKIADFCYSIQAVHKIITEDGKQKIGVYVVLDGKEPITQQSVFDAIDRVSDMHEKTSRFLLKTF